MKKFVLHQTGKLSEFGDEAAEKIDPVHHSQDPADFPLLRKDRKENLARCFSVLIRPGNETERARHQIVELRTQVEVFLLGELKHTHHLERVLLKNVAPLGV